MPAMTQTELFHNKYENVGKIWSDVSFIKLLGILRTLLSELPVSRVAAATREYSTKYTGNLDNIYGEIMFTLSEYEGYLRDKAFIINECFIKPIFKPDNIILEFNILYKTKQGEEVTRSYELIRNGERNFIFFANKYRLT